MRYHNFITIIFELWHQFPFVYSILMSSLLLQPCWDLVTLRMLRTQTNSTHCTACKQTEVPIWNKLTSLFFSSHSWMLNTWKQNVKLTLLLKRKYLPLNQEYAQYALQGRRMIQSHADKIFKQIPHKDLYKYHSSFAHQNLFGHRFACRWYHLHY